MPYPSKTDRPTILATALSQVSRDGIDKLAIRSVAAELGLAPNALYRYFVNLAALEDALADESRRRLLGALQRAAGKKQPEAAIRSISKAYLQFARENAQIFALTLRPSANYSNDDAVHLQSWRFVVEQVSRLYGKERAPQAAVSLWAFLHGMTALEAAGVFGDRKPASGFEFGLRMWIETASLEAREANGSLETT